MEKREIVFPRPMIEELKDKLNQERLDSDEDKCYLLAISELDKMKPELNDEYVLDKNRMIKKNLYILRNSKKFLKENECKYSKEVSKYYNTIESVIKDDFDSMY